MRSHPITDVYKLHSGIDISAPTGANFIAANDGIVTKASYNSAYGNMVIIDHGGGVSTLYAHGSEILVEVGQTVKRGDSIYIPSGTVHAICGGLLICEVQQNSSLTYRLYDYDRVDKTGKKRELHIDKALQVVNTAAVTKPNQDVVRENECVRRLASCKYFTVREITVAPEYKGRVDEECFLSLTCTCGDGLLEWQDSTFTVDLGDTFFLPAGLGDYTLRGNMTLIAASV